MTPPTPTKRLPTEQQFRRLMVFGSGAMLVSGTDRATAAFLKRGWLAPENPDLDERNGLRITPTGLRALADAADRYGVPTFKALKKDAG